ncbi:MAG: KH domain-containing protein [Anaerovoracaceae bacterium]
MTDLVKDIAMALVDKPEEVEVTEAVGEEGETIIKLKVADDDMGKVIGKQGRIARAIRLIVRAATVKEDKQVMVEIVE